MEGEGQYILSNLAIFTVRGYPVQDSLAGGYFKTKKSSKTDKEAKHGERHDERGSSKNPHVRHVYGSLHKCLETQ